MAIQCTVCAKCKSTYTCKGKARKVYNEALFTDKIGGRYQPVCADKVACEERVKTKQPLHFLWDNSQRYQLHNEYDVPTSYWRERTEDADQATSDARIEQSEERRDEGDRTDIRDRSENVGEGSGQGGAAPIAVHDD